MTEKELRTWMRKESLSDAWYVSASDGHVDGDLLTLSQIFERYTDKNPTARNSVLVLHESQQDRKNPAWIDLDLHSFTEESLPQAPSHAGSAQHSRSNTRPSRRNKRRARGMIIQLIVLFVLIIAGLASWYIITNEEPERITFVSEEAAHERMLATLQQNMLRNNPKAQADEGEPIRTVVSATQRMLMIKNSNLEDWPSFNLRIITPSGQTYHCSFDQIIPAYSTLSISMRKIVTDKGDSLTREDLRSGTIIQLDIPGYKSWSSTL